MSLLTSLRGANTSGLDIRFSLTRGVSKSRKLTRGQIPTHIEKRPVLPPPYSCEALLSFHSNPPCTSYCKMRPSMKQVPTRVIFRYESERVSAIMTYLDCYYPSMQFSPIEGIFGVMSVPVDNEWVLTGTATWILFVTFVVGLSLRRT
jgi:hypothetical protein